MKITKMTPAEARVLGLVPAEGTIFATRRNLKMGRNAQAKQLPFRINGVEFFTRTLANRTIESLASGEVSEQISTGIRFSYDEAEQAPQTKAFLRSAEPGQRVLSCTLRRDRNGRLEFGAGTVESSGDFKGLTGGVLHFIETRNQNPEIDAATLDAINEWLELALENFENQDLPTETGVGLLASLGK